MILDKITSEIKERMKDAIKDTIKTGNEYSFFICKDENGNLPTTHITKGTETKILMGPPVKCPYKTQRVLPATLFLMKLNVGLLKIK